MERSVRARSGWRKISPTCGSMAVRAGNDAFEVGHARRTAALEAMLLRAHFVDREAVGQFDGRFDHLGERLRAELAQRHQPASTMPGTSAGINPATGIDALQSARIRRSKNFAGLQRVLAEEIGGGQLGHGADAGDRVDLARLGADQDRRFAAHSEMREFGDRSGEHGGDARVHRVAAVVVHAHAGFGGVLAARGHRSMHAANGLPHGPVGLPAHLRPTQRRQRERNQQLVSHGVPSTQEGDRPLCPQAHLVDGTN